MARRHWALLLVWSGLVALVVLGAILPLADKSLLGLAFLISPIVAIVTLVRVFRRNVPEPMAHRWAIVQRVLAGTCVAFAIGGLVGSASQLTEIGGKTTMQNGPLALLFLLSLIGSYHALVRPTPRNNAIPAVIVHVAWMPLVLVNQHRSLELEQWQKAITGLGILGLLGASAFAAMLALAGFAGAPARVPEARQL